jgi:hypothetical protein
MTKPEQQNSKNRAVEQQSNRAGGYYGKIFIPLKNYCATALLLYCSIFILLFSSCSKDEVKGPSQEAIIAKEAMDLVNSIKEAYMAQDEEKIKQMISSEQVLKDLSFSGGPVTSPPTSLEFLFRWIDIYNSKGGEVTVADVYVSWKGLWKKDSQEIEQKGLALFVLEGRPFKLKKILRENPFVRPVTPP